MNHPLTNPNGQIIALEAGQYSAGIATVGAGIQSLRLNGRAPGPTFSRDGSIPFP
jgi:hypothetical protein